MAKDTHALQAPPHLYLHLCYSLPIPPAHRHLCLRPASNLVITRTQLAPGLGECGGVGEWSCNCSVLSAGLTLDFEKAQKPGLFFFFCQFHFFIRQFSVLAMPTNL